MVTQSGEVVRHVDLSHNDYVPCPVQLQIGKSRKYVIHTSKK
jgi:hypothetical protein